MSKVVVYVLDKIVWMLLITAVTTQALQIAGVVEGPKGLGDISYRQDPQYNFQVQVGDNDARGKRNADQRSQFIDSLFNLPISTLNAVNNLVQSTRPAFQSLRDYAMKTFDAKSSKSVNTGRPAVKTTEKKGPKVSNQKREVNNTTNLARQQSRVYPVYVRPQGEVEDLS